MATHLDDGVYETAGGYVNGGFYGGKSIEQGKTDFPTAHNALDHLYKKQLLDDKEIGECPDC